MGGTKGRSKTDDGLYFEDFDIGGVLLHASARTVTEGDVAIYHALYGARFALQSSDEFARAIGLPCAPVDDFLTLQLVLGKSRPDVARHALAELACRDARFTAPLYPGDTVVATSTVTGLVPGADERTGIVHLRTVGTNQDRAVVFECSRAFLVRRRRTGAGSANEGVAPDLHDAVDPDTLVLPRGLRVQSYDFERSGSPYRWDDYTVGERIDHGGGTLIDGSEALLAARFFEGVGGGRGRSEAPDVELGGRPPVYPGHVLGLARSLSFRGLENAFRVLAVNRLTHCHPACSGDTIFARTEVLDRHELPGVSKVGALRLRLMATAAPVAPDSTVHDASGRCDPPVLLDLDYTVALPR